MVYPYVVRIVRCAEINVSILALFSELYSQVVAGRLKAPCKLGIGLFCLRDIGAQPTQDFRATN